MGTRRCSVLDTPGVLGRAVRRFSPNAEDGFTLIEMLVVMIVLLAILAPLTGSLVSAQTAQADQTRRLDAQENARQALDRMRKDIHCAHGVTDPYANDSGGYTIVMTETNTTGVAECPNLVQTNASGVQWCTIPVAGATDRYQLYRENDPDDDVRRRRGDVHGRLPDQREHLGEPDVCRRPVSDGRGDDAGRRRPLEAPGHVHAQRPDRAAQRRHLQLGSASSIDPLVRARTPLRWA